MKKLVALLVLFCFVLVGTFALDASVVWYWYRNDRAVKYYRYQLDGEDDDNWTVVSSNVLEISLDVDVSVSHVLYLQQSYDGIHWSESSYAESEIYESSGIPEDDDFYWDEYEEYPEDEEILEEEPEEVVVQEVEETTAVTQTPKLSKSFINIAISYRNSIPNDKVGKTVGPAISFTHLFPLSGNIFTSGFRVESAFYTTGQIFEGLNQTDYFVTLSVLGVMNFAPNRGDFSIGFGPEAQLQFGVSDTTLWWGLNSVLALRFKISDQISLGFSTADHFYFYPEKINVYDFKAGVSLSI